MSVVVFLLDKFQPLPGVGDPSGRFLLVHVVTTTTTGSGDHSVLQFGSLAVDPTLKQLRDIVVSNGCCTRKMIHLAAMPQVPNDRVNQVMALMEEWIVEPNDEGDEMTTMPGPTHENNPTKNVATDAAPTTSPSVQFHPHVTDKDFHRLIKQYIKPPASLQLSAMVLSKGLQCALSLYLGMIMTVHPASSPTNPDYHDYHYYSQLKPLRWTSSLSLDATVAETLHLWPPLSQDSSNSNNSNKTSSLYNLVPLQTKPGQRLWCLWLMHPLTDPTALEQRHDAVEWLLQRTVGRNALADALHGDCLTTALALANHSEHSNKKHAGGLPALYQLYIWASQTIPAVTHALQTVVVLGDGGNDESTSSSPNHHHPTLLVEAHRILEQSCQALQKSIDLVEAVLDLNLAPREYVIQASYKEELQQIASELDDVEQELQLCWNSVQDMWNGVAATSGDGSRVRLEEQQQGDYQFRLPDANHSKLLQTLPVTIHKLLKNGVYFSTKELRQIVCKKQDLLAEYHRHQQQVVAEAMAVAATFVPVLYQVHDAMALVDVLVALAQTAAHRNYVRPHMTDHPEPKIVLHQARHPCVELQESVDYIPNDVRLVHGESSFLIVTGPNMGGKSTYLRAIGTSVLLAQVGSFVPCTAATINICHDILARVGAGDQQENGISTFMAEMLESSAILNRATQRSLILIDELGRGTSTFDGYGLARAISEYIVQEIGCATVFTTHFHELTALEQCHPGVENRHVTAIQGTHGLTFLYQVKAGPCLESFGIQVAEMANVPSVVVQDAKRKARELENFVYHGYEEGEEDASELVDRFRHLDLQRLLSEHDASDETRKAALWQALQA